MGCDGPMSKPSGAKAGPAQIPIPNPGSVDLGSEEEVPTQLCADDAAIAPAAEQ